MPNDVVFRWVQNYDPFGSWPVSTAVAALPVLVLMGLLISGKATAWQAAIGGLLTALVAAAAAFGMPIDLALWGAFHGVVLALFRIVWLIVSAVFLYNIAVATGQFEVMKASVASLSADRRLQAVLVAFAFGAFIEGAAGFGAPVAISAAFLVGLGFDPFRAAVLCLIANTAPVAWGSIGIPIKTLADVTGLDVEKLSVMAGRILPPVSLIIPFWLVWVLAGGRATIAVWPALLAIGGAFAATQFAWSNFVGVDLVDLVSAAAALAAGVAVLKVWKPRIIWRFPHDTNNSLTVQTDVAPLSARRVLRAWTPFLLLSAFVFTWGLPTVKDWFAKPHAIPHGPRFQLSWKPALPGLHLQIAKGEAVTGRPVPISKDLEKAELDIVPFSATGTAVFLSAVASGLWLGIRPAALARMFALTMVRLFPAITTIFAMLALGFVTRYSGMDAVLGLAFTRTSAGLYPIFGALLGWLGVALTGSDTSSNVLFGNLQRITAEKLGINPILMASANSTGGVMGKMIDAQSIVVAAAATGEGGEEGRILRAVLWHSLALALIVAAIVWTYAHFGAALVPKLD